MFNLKNYSVVIVGNGKRSRLVWIPILESLGLKINNPYYKFPKLQVFQNFTKSSIYHYLENYLNYLNNQESLIFSNNDAMEIIDLNNKN